MTTGDPAERLGAAELAAMTGTSEADLSVLAAAGVLQPTDGWYAPGDVHRVRVIAAFQTSGVPLEALIAGAEAGHVRLGAYDELHESLGPGSARSYGAFRAAVDPDGERLTGLYTALGLAEPRDGTHLPVADERMLEAWLAHVEDTGDPALATRVVRLYGEAARRTADGALQAYAEAVRQLDAAFAELDEEAYFTLLDRWTGLAHGLPALAGWLSARHVSTAIDTFSVELVERILSVAGYVPAPQERRHGIAFVDLTGFTEATRERGDEIAARWSLRLGELARATAEPRGGRLVKLLGDGALVHFPDGDAAVAGALDLLDAIAHDGLGMGHAGVDHGPVVHREGDVFGRTVNLAARLSDHAPAGALYVTMEAATTLAMDGLVVRPAGILAVQGVGEVEVAQLERGPSG